MNLEENGKARDFHLDSGVERLVDSILEQEDMKVLEQEDMKAL